MSQGTWKLNAIPGLGPNGLGFWAASKQYIFVEIWCVPQDANNNNNNNNNNKKEKTVFLSAQ